MSNTIRSVQKQSAGTRFCRCLGAALVWAAATALLASASATENQAGKAKTFTIVNKSGLSLSGIKFIYDDKYVENFLFDTPGNGDDIRTVAIRHSPGGLSSIHIDMDLAFFIFEYVPLADADTLELSLRVWSKPQLLLKREGVTLYQTTGSLALTHVHAHFIDEYPLRLGSKTLNAYDYGDSIQVYEGYFYTRIGLAGLVWDVSGMIYLGEAVRIDMTTQLDIDMLPEVVDFLEIADYKVILIEQNMFATTMYSMQSVNTTFSYAGFHSYLQRFIRQSGPDGKLRAVFVNADAGVFWPSNLATQGDPVSFFSSWDMNGEKGPEIFVLTIDKAKATATLSNYYMHPAGIRHLVAEPPADRN